MFDYVKQVSVGYDALIKELRSFSKELEPDWNSPYNILVKDGKYSVQFYVPGVPKEKVFVGFEGGVLTVTTEKDCDNSDFVFRSVVDSAISVKLLIARHLDVEKADVKDGILTIDFVSVLPARRDRVIALGGTPVVVDVPVVDIPVIEPEVPVIVDATVPEAPTVEVVMPEVLPVVVEITDVIIAPVVDPVSEVPQVTIELSDATAEVAVDVPVETIVIETPAEDAPNIVVVAPVETVAAIEAAGVDIQHVVEEAVAAAVEAETATLPVDTAPVVEAWTEGEATVVPVETKEEFPNTEIIIPDTIPTVVEVVKTEADTLELVPVDMTEFKEESYEALIPVVTAEGQPDILVAVAPEVKVELETKLEDVSASLAAAVQSAEPMIVTTVDTVPLEVPAVMEATPEPEVVESKEPVASE